MTRRSAVYVLCGVLLWLGVAVAGGTEQRSVVLLGGQPYLPQLEQVTTSLREGWSIRRSDHLAGDQVVVVTLERPRYYRLLELGR